MNEPVAQDPEEWNSLVERCTKAIRALEPERRLVIGSNMWQSVDTFDVLRVPAGDSHIILSFHYYSPMVLTHYRASWTKVGEYSGPVTYPGRLVPEDQFLAQPAELQRAMSPENMVFDRATTARKIAKPLEVARRLNLPLYCGEWGCIDDAPMDARVRWYQDVCAVLDGKPIGWATWDYQGGFGSDQGRPAGHAGNSRARLEYLTSPLSDLQRRHINASAPSRLSATQDLLIRFAKRGRPRTAGLPI